MKKKKLFKRKRIVQKHKPIHESIIGLVEAVAVFLYVVLVSFFLSVGQIIFANFNSIMASTFVLALLVLSVLFIVLAIFGYPVLLHSQKQTRKGIYVAGYSFVWLLAILAVFVVITIR